MRSKILMLVLRPFARPLRHGALKIMKRLYNPIDNRPVIAASEHLLNEIVLPSVFTTFQAGRFRDLARFKKLPVSEHDRIFNELEVAGVFLTTLYLQNVTPLLEPVDSHFWQSVAERLPKELQNILIGYGADGGDTKLMRQLIDMRSDEYRALAWEVLKANNEENESEDFKALPPEMKKFAATVQASAVGITEHIRRGKREERDPLIGYLTEWLLSLRRDVAKFVKNL